MTRRGGDAFGAHIDQRRRLLIAVPLGLLAAIAAAFFCPWQLVVLVGWDVVALVVAISVWSFITVLDAEGTHRVATREDDTRAGADVIMLVACVMSLVGVVAGLAHAQNHLSGMSNALTAVAVFTVVLSWFTVHTLFVLRYARLFYGDPPGGIEFTDSQPPDYLDFVYVAFTIGMTFQVSDTGIAQRSIRRTVIRHALVSYLYGTVIIGVAINVVGNLIRG